MKSSGGVTITQKMHGVEKFGVAMAQVKSWILEYVVEPNANLNGFPPCPYAKQAMLENKVRFLETTNIKMFLEKANQEVDTWDDSVDVCVFIFTKMNNNKIFPTLLFQKCFDISKTILQVAKI